VVFIFIILAMDPNNTPDTEDRDERYSSWIEFDEQINEITALVSAEIATEHHKKYCTKTPKRTSPWKGSNKTEDLLNLENKDRHQEQLRMPLKTFRKLVQWLAENTDLQSTQGTRESTSIEEKVYMFLYVVGQNASSRATQESFQCSGWTVTA
jgi:hypothetical protein